MFGRITFNPKIMAGRACIGGMRITVSLLVNLVANGMSPEEIVREYPDLKLRTFERPCATLRRWPTRKFTHSRAQRCEASGRTAGSPILSAQSLSAMTSDQTNGRGPGRGTAFGFGLSVVTDPVLAHTPQSAGTFAWGGDYGHAWFVDPAKRLTVIVLTNTAVEGMSGQFPAQIRDAIYAGL